MRKYSFITVCFNSENVLRRTLDSILAIEDENYEYIVVDGGSTDGTIELLQMYEQKFKGKMRWISEKDNGIYDAMNKGVKMSRGDYLAFINAQDVFLLNSLIEIDQIISKMNGKVDIVYGDTIYVYQYNGEVIKKTQKARDEITLTTLKRGMGVVHQSMFTSRSLFDRIGMFNQLYSIGGDWDFLIRAVRSGAILEHHPCVLCEFDASGVSAGVHNIQRHKIRKANQLYTYVDWDLIKDATDIRLMIQLLIGKNNYSKLRGWFNKKKKEENVYNAERNG